ncbi:MAG: hypothetical protein CMJ34_08460 [Phycisphaerae bacterium]|nr:hypothetical protein [Phycisphaerae bacterium]
MTSLARLLLAACLVAASIAIATTGGDAIPIWVVGISARLDVSPEIGARITAGACAALAGIVVLLGRRGRTPARLVAAALALSGLADGSAIYALGDEATVGFLRPLLQLAVGLLTLWGLSTGRKESKKSPMRHPGLAGAGVIASLAVGAAIAANIDVPMPESFRNASGSNARGADGRFIVNDLQADEWAGMTLEETGLLEHLPAIAPLSQSQPTLISFYRSNCGLCHDLFDKHFGGRLPVRLIAIQVPPAEGVELVENDLPEDVVCPDCVRLKLPEGPVWLVTTPVVVEIVDGRIACVSQDDFERCIDDAITRQDAMTTDVRDPPTG